MPFRMSTAVVAPAAFIKTLLHPIPFFALLFLGLGGVVHAVSWTSSTTGGAIEATVIEPNPAAPAPALIVYLKNLNCERIGQESDASIVADIPWLRALTPEPPLRLHPQFKPTMRPSPTRHE